MNQRKRTTPTSVLERNIQKIMEFCLSEMISKFFMISLRHRYYCQIMIPSTVHCSQGSTQFSNSSEWHDPPMKDVEKNLFVWCTQTLRNTHLIQIWCQHSLAGNWYKLNVSLIRIHLLPYHILDFDQIELGLKSSIDWKQFNENRLFSLTTCCEFRKFSSNIYHDQLIFLFTFCILES